ncbi:mszf55-1 [Clostridium botulinum]|nr:mszf55-1 [Clostridium botulinum]
MNKKIKCDLCMKTIPYNSKITMKNKINKSTIYICKDCFNEFFNDSVQINKINF